MMASSSNTGQLVDGSDHSGERLSSGSPPLLGVRSLVIGENFLNEKNLTSTKTNQRPDKEFLNRNRESELSLPAKPLQSGPTSTTKLPSAGDSDDSHVKLTGFSSEFAKFIETTSVCDAVEDTYKQFVTKKCSVRLFPLDFDVCKHLSMESKTNSSSIDIAGVRDSNKRDSELSNDGPLIKRPKGDDVIIIDAEISNKTSPEISVVKLAKTSPKENANVPNEKKSDLKPSESKSKSEKPFKPISTDTSKKLDSPSNKTNKSAPSNSKLDNSDRTSLLSLEARLLDLQQRHQQKSKSNDNHQKIKSMSPSALKTNKDNHHRRTEAFLVDRKKPVSSPVKKMLKKTYSAPATPKESKLGGLFCPTTDAKVTILPCKTVPKEGGEAKPVAAGSNSVTITKVSSGDTINVAAKDVKKAFSPKSESKAKLSTASSFKHGKTSPKTFAKEKLKSGEKSDRPPKEHRHRDKVYRSKDSSKDGRERGDRRERVGSLKIIRCSKCREVFSTKEAKKLHTCNSILDAHYLIDGGDRQKTSPVSSASNSDRSESTSASLSRSSSRSSSPGLPMTSLKRTGDSPKPKVVKKLDDDKVAKVKISISKVKSDDDDRNRDKKLDKSIVKKDPMREKWIENKIGGKLERSDHDPSLEESMKNRSQGLVIEAVQSSNGGSNSHQSSNIDSVKSDVKDGKTKEEGFTGDPAIFSFPGKRTYSPSMTESTQLDGKESPRETNSKDSPASQADSGVFSIASSASPSKVDGGINSDVRSPESPRPIESTLGKQEHSQWKPSVPMNQGPTHSRTQLNMNMLKNSSLSGKDSSGNGFPQGISLPENTSITRVLPTTTNYSVNSSSLNKHLGPNPGGTTWINNQRPQMENNYFIDENAKKKRGRPRKNGDPIFSGKFKNPKPKMSDDDKDLYDFEMEDDETKPMQPLRPRRQNAQPVTYKDPDSDEDAKGRQPQIPLIQTTQGYKDIHEKALTLNTTNYDSEPLHDGDQATEGPPDGEEGEEKDKNISYKCSRIEETPTGGIKLKIKIKKSASPGPVTQDPEPPLKKSKIDTTEEFDPSMLSEIGMNTLQNKPNQLEEEKHHQKSDPPQIPPVSAPISSSTATKPSNLILMTPGLAGGMQPKNTTPPHTSHSSLPPVRPFGSNNNPPSGVTSTEEIPKGPTLPKVQNPYAIQKLNFPHTHSSNQNNFEMQQNFSSGLYSDFPNYNMPYSGYMEHSPSQGYPNNPFPQHMPAYRPGIRPTNPMMQRPQLGNYTQNRMMDPRFPPHQTSMSEADPMQVGVNSHMSGMPLGLGMASHGNPAMGRHPAMMAPMLPNLSNPNIPIGSYPNAPMNVPVGIGQKPMPPAMSTGVPKGPMMNSPVMSPIPGHGGIIPRSMSPQAIGVPERPLICPPSMSPQSIPGNERNQMFPSNQYRMSSPQYSPAHQGQPQPSFSHSPTYAATQGYPQHTNSNTYKPPTPQSYSKPPTPQNCPKPPTPQSYPKPPTPQNPTTPGSYPNPSTPGAYQNPATPVSHQNPLTPQSYDPQTPLGSQHNSSIESPTTQPVIQQTPQAAPTSFIVPKTESVIQSPVHFTKITTPMLSPPSTTSSLRKIRRPSKSVTPGTVSPNQKTLSPNQSQPTVKIENDSVIVPKSEPLHSLSPVPTKSESAPNIKKEPDISPKAEIKQEPAAVEQKPDSPPPTVKTPEPPKDPRWGEDGADGMPENVLARIFAYVCHTDGCLPFLPHAMRVCKLWNKVASDPKLWTHANLGSAVKEKLRNERKLEWILKNKFPHAIQVDVTSWKAVMSTPALKIIATNCPNLSGLGLSNCVKLNYEDIRIVPSLFPNLERIDLSLVSPSTASSRSAVSSSALSDLIAALGEKLTHFNMSSNKMAGLPFVFKALSQHSKNLTFLDVSNISTTSRDTILINIEKLAKGCPKLTTFRTTNTMLGLNDVPVREQVMSPGFPSLEELTIGVDQRGYFDGMDDGQIERILKKSNKLRLLDIRGCKGISDSTLVRLPCWDIEYLYVAGCSVTSSSRDGLELLVKKWCSTLIELDIGLTNDQKTVDWAVMALVEFEGSLRLRKLYLNGTAVSLKPLTRLLNCCTTLESLNLSSCRALPRGMKRMYHSKEDVASLRKDIEDGKFDPRDAGSEEDD